MAEDYTPDVLDRASWSGNRAGEDLVNRQNKINQELARRLRDGGEGTEGLQDQIDVINAQITVIQTDIIALETEFTNLQDYISISVSATGSQSIGPNRFLSVDFTVGVGAGTYVYDLALTGTKGSEVKILVHSPSSANRVLNVRDATVGGTILQTMTSTLVARIWTGLFIHNGTAWVKHSFQVLT